MKQRILTAIVGIAVLALAIWKIDTVIFVCAIALACIFISIEVQNAVKTKNKPLKVVCAVYAASIPFLFAFASLEQFHLLPAVSLLFFILILYFLFCYINIFNYSISSIYFCISRWNYNIFYCICYITTRYIK